MPIDISKVQYRLIALLPSGGTFFLSRPNSEIDLLLSATLEEQPGELAARLELQLKNVKTKDGWIHQHVSIGRRLILQATDGNGWQEVWRGQVYRHSVSTDNDSTVAVTAYDMLYPLQQSKVHRYFRSGETGASCIKSLAQEWRIPLGRIEGPNVRLPAKLYRGERIGSIFADRLEQSQRLGGGRWVIRDVQGRVNCKREGSNTTVYRIDANFAESSEDEWNIERLVTRVKVYGKEKKEGHPPLVATKDGKTEYGIFQEVVYATGDNVKDALTEANEILAESGKPERRMMITAPIIPWIRKGDKVNVKVGTVNGDCIVEGVMHDITQLKMTLQLSQLRRA